MQKQAKTFLIRNKQNPDLNQYWYSDKTIQFLSKQANKFQKCCFMSTPSVFYSMQDYLQRQYYLFDFDDKFSKNNPRFFKYDFNKPEEIPQKYQNFFDFVLVDPPFITEEVWAKYAAAIKKIIKKNQQNQVIGNILLTTIGQNSQLLEQLIGVKKTIFKPSIPNLVYQYSLYSNYNDQELNQPNPQIPE